MAQRRFHYDAAFEHFLRANAIPYVAVDEAKRALGQAQVMPRPGDAAAHAPLKLKSFDFVVYSSAGSNLLVDVKGRKHSGRTGRSLHNWVTRDDVTHLQQWERYFGPGFEAAFAFLFWCDAQPPDALFHEVFTFADRWYTVLAIRLRDYAPHVRQRSAQWDTVSIPADVFTQHAVPLKQLL